MIECEIYKILEKDREYRRELNREMREMDLANAELKAEVERLKLQIEEDSPTSRDQIQRLYNEECKLSWARYCEIVRLKKNFEDSYMICGRHIEMEQLRRGIFVDEHYRVHDIAECQPQKPVVWVRDYGDSGIYFCDDNGKRIENSWCSRAGYRATQLWLNGKVEVRVWEEPAPAKPVCPECGASGSVLSYCSVCGEPKPKPAPEPEVWEYAVWKDSHGCFCPEFKGNPKGNHLGHRQEIEDAIADLLNPNEWMREWMGIDRTKLPAFGVRKNEWGYSAYRDGKRIRGTGDGNPEKCIKDVLYRLTPAVTLADLKVCE